MEVTYIYDILIQFRVHFNILNSLTTYVLQAKGQSYLWSIVAWLPSTAEI